MLERANFLAIFASNLDEFFMVRVAGLKRRIVTGGLAVPTNVGRAPMDVLEDISRAAHDLQERHARVYQELVKPALAEAGIRVVAWADLGDAERAHLREYFSQQMFPVLMPLAVDPAHPFPYISGSRSTSRCACATAARAVRSSRASRCRRCCRGSCASTRPSPSRTRGT